MQKNYNKPNINIIGECEQMNKLIKEKLSESKIYNNIYIDTVNNENENTDITICASLSMYDKMEDYYGVKVLFTGAVPQVLKMKNIENTYIIYKDINSLSEIAKKVYNFYLNTQNT